MHPKTQKESIPLFWFEKGFGIMPRAIWEDSNLDFYQKGILALLLSYTGTKSIDAYPSIKTIVAESGLSESKVIKTLKSLDKLDYIDKIRRFPDNPMKRQLQYRLIFLKNYPDPQNSANLRNRLSASSYLAQEQFQPSSEKGVNKNIIPVNIIPNNSKELYNGFSQSHEKGTSLFPNGNPNLSIEEELLKAVAATATAAGYQVRFPKAGKPPTKVLLEICQIFREIQAGTFVTMRDWDSQWMKKMQIHDRLESCKGLSFVEIAEYLRKPARRVFKARNSPGKYEAKYEPKNFKQFLYNSNFKSPKNSQKSRMLYYLNNPLRTSGEYVKDSQKAQIPEKASQMAQNLLKEKLDAKGRVWDDRALNLFWDAITKLQTWHEKNRGRLKEYNEGWGTWCGSFSSFFSLVVRFVGDENGTSGLKWELLQVGENRGWQGFRTWMRHEYEIDLDPSDNDWETRKTQQTTEAEAYREQEIKMRMEKIGRAVEEAGREAPDDEKLREMAKKDLLDDEADRLDAKKEREFRRG